MSAGLGAFNGFRLVSSTKAGPRCVSSRNQTSLLTVARAIVGNTPLKFSVSPGLMSLILSITADFTSAALCSATLPFPRLTKLVPEATAPISVPLRQGSDWLRWPPRRWRNIADDERELRRGEGERGHNAEAGDPVKNGAPELDPALAEIGPFPTVSARFKSLSARLAARTFLIPSASSSTPRFQPSRRRSIGSSSIHRGRPGRLTFSSCIWKNGNFQSARELQLFLYLLRRVGVSRIDQNQGRRLYLSPPGIYPHSFR